MSVGQKIRYNAAIDFGSEYTRFVAIRLDADAPVGGARDDHDWLYLHNISNNANETGAYGEHEFPSACLPFDPIPAAIGDEALGRPGNVSLKFCLYIIVLFKYRQIRTAASVHGAERIVRNFSKYRHLRRLLRNSTDVNFVKKLREMLVRHFKTIRRAVLRVYPAEKYEALETVLTIPANGWDKTFQEIYEGIFLEAWGQATRNDSTIPVTFVYETEAVAHLIKSKRPDILEDFSVVCVVDVGGHTMGISTFFCDEDAIYIVDASVGIECGSAYWDLLILGDIARYLRDNGIEDSGSTIARGLLREFRISKSSFGSERSSSQKPVLRHGQGVVLTYEQVLSRYQQAFQPGFQLFQQKLQKAAQCEPRGKVAVILCGGSLQCFGAYQDFYRRARKLSQESGCHNIVCFRARDDISNGLPTMIISQGATIALTNRLTVKEFMERGAGLGLQKSSNIKAPVIISGNEPGPSAKISVNVDENDELRIICDPYFQNRGLSHLQCATCYDVYEFSDVVPGKYEFQFAWVQDESNRDWLEIRQSYFNGSRWFVTLKEYELLYDIGTGVIHVEWDASKEDEQDTLVRARSVTQVEELQ